MAAPQPSRAQSPPDDPRTRDPRGASPAMAQWFALKAHHPDALLFFRMGDFYELFFADAEAAAAALDIALTSRGEHGGSPIPMCGVPIHAAETYLARLIRRGFRVAVAEQMEDPKANAPARPRSGARSCAWSPPAPHRRRVAGFRAPQPAGRTGAGRAGHRGGMARCLHRPVRDRVPSASRTPGAARPPGTGGNPGARHPRARRPRAPARPGNRRFSAAGVAPSARRSIRRRQPGCVRQLHAMRRRWPPPWRSITSAPPRPARCPASPARRRKAKPECWRWMRRPAPAWSCCAPATAAYCTR